MKIASHTIGLDPMPLLGHSRHFDRAVLTAGLPLAAQPVATQGLNLSAGVSNDKVLRGRSFIRQTRKWTILTKGEQRTVVFLSCGSLVANLSR